MPPLPVSETGATIGTVAVATGVNVGSGESSGEGGTVTGTGVGVTQPVKNDKTTMKSVKFRNDLMVSMAIQSLFFQFQTERSLRKDAELSKNEPLRF
jgi:hypothetical protein